MARDKLKILYLMKLLLDETDPQHPMNATQLCERMENRYGCSYERRSVYSAQSQMLKRHLNCFLNNEGLGNIEIGTVDAFQEKEFDYVTL